MKERFIIRNFTAESLKLITQANAIIEEYTAQRFVLTLRQLYYQMVARDILRNTVQNYKRLGSILNDARYAGLVDWAAMEDRTRGARSGSHWDTPAAIIKSAAYSYAIDKWKGQDYRPELWVEKEALASIVQRAAEENDCPYLSCRGYMSASEMYEAAQRIRHRRNLDQETVIIYLGDHDPSGLDMSDGDIPKRFQIFMDKYGMDAVEIRRVALNWDQIEEYNPPPNPAKETDSRFGRYQELYGDESWELDALEPNVLLALINDTIEEIRNDLMWQEAVEREEAERAVLNQASERWPQVVKFLAKPAGKGKKS